MRTGQRRGVTLIEVLTAIAILGLLIALLLPAIQAAREAGRRASCVNNLRQLGLALANYEASCGILPPGGYSLEYSPFTRLLPFLEQGDLFNQINFSLPGRSGPNSVHATVCVVRLSVLNCPSDRSSIVTNDPSTSYAGSFGSGEDAIEGNGVFAFRKFIDPIPIRFADVIDGSSHTAALAEWLPDRVIVPHRDEKRSIFNIFPTSGGTPAAGDLRTICRDLDIDALDVAQVDGSKGRLWMHGGNSSLYNHVMLPNERSCGRGGNSSDAAITAASDHPGGAQILLLDGHVKFATNSVSLATWKAIGSRNGGEVVDANSF